MTAKHNADKLADFIAKLKEGSATSDDPFEDNFFDWPAYKREWLSKDQELGKQAVAAALDKQRLRGEFYECQSVTERREWPEDDERDSYI